jgi:hypothetical protein
LACFYLRNLSVWSLISVVAIHMHPSMCSSVRRVPVLDLWFFINLIVYSQRLGLENTDYINKMRFLIKSNYVFVIPYDTLLSKTRRPLKTHQQSAR